jgi:type II secretory pathway component PulK
MTNSSGVVLLMVLILSAIMYLIASTLLLITMTEIHISDFEQRSTQAFYAAESSVTLGLSKLRENPDYRHKNDLYDTSIGGNPGYFIV